MEVLTDIGHQITARRLMHIILYDNGAVSRFDPDDKSKYPKKHFDKITDGCELFFNAHSNLLTNDNLELIATGERSEVETAFSIYSEFALLDSALDNWFNEGI